MAGAGLIDIKRRIKSVTNTRKITKAMGLVATSKLRKIRLALEVNNRYFQSIQKVSDEFLAALEDVDRNIYFNNSSKKKLYIVMTSDSGLCGGYNANVVQKLKANADKDNEDPLIMVVGQKGIPYVRKYGFETTAEYIQITDIPTVKESRIIFEHALRLYKEGEVGEINIVYTQFVSSVIQEVRTKKFLPLERQDKKSEGEYLIEPSGNEVIENVLDIYLKAVVQNIMLHSKCSEYSSRMSAMDGASKNANDLLDALNTKYNRIRQTSITQEITEIVSGAQAQN